MAGRHNLKENKWGVVIVNTIKVWTTSGLAKAEEGEEIIREMGKTREKRLAAENQAKLDEANLVAGKILRKR